MLTTAELDIDEPYKDDLCGNCEKYIIAFPTKALEPYKLKINRCLTYAAEDSNAKNVPDDVRKIEKRLIKKNIPHSYIECATGIETCSIGKPLRTEKTMPLKT